MKRTRDTVRVAVCAAFLAATAYVNFACKSNSNPVSSNCGSGNTYWDGKYPNQTCREVGSGKALDPSCCGG